MYKITLLLVEGIFDRSSFNQAVFSPFLFLFFSPACSSVSAIIRWNRRPHGLGRFPHSCLIPLFCSQSLVLGGHFHPRSTYLRYTGMPTPITKSYITALCHWRCEHHSFHHNNVAEATVNAETYRDHSSQGPCQSCSIRLI